MFGWRKRARSGSADAETALETEMDRVASRTDYPENADSVADPLLDAPHADNMQNETTDYDESIPSSDNDFLGLDLMSSDAVDDRDEALDATTEQTRGDLAMRDVEPTQEPSEGLSQTDLKNAELHVGPGITLKGDITTCEALIVQGNVNGTIDCAQMQVLSGGVVDGTATVQMAEIEGSFTGTLSVTGLLRVRGAGKIQGTIRYGELEVERGCEVSGDVAQSDLASDGEKPEGRRFMRGSNPAGVRAA